jgi:hypothetical protein
MVRKVTNVSVFYIFVITNHCSIAIVIVSLLKVPLTYLTVKMLAWFQFNYYCNNKRYVINTTFWKKWNNFDWSKELKIFPLWVTKSYFICKLRYDLAPRHLVLVTIGRMSGVKQFFLNVLSNLSGHTDSNAYWTRSTMALLLP